MAAKYTLIVGTASWSSWSLRPFLALYQTRQPFETVMVPLRWKGESRAMIQKYSPSGKVPLLKISEPASSSKAVGHKKSGKTQKIWDSLAICEALADRHPKAGLWPANAAARANARAYAAEMHSGFPNLRDQLTLMFGQKLKPPALHDDTRREIARILAAWEAALKVSKGSFLFGRFSIADAMYAPVVSRFDTYGVKVSRPVRAYMDKVLALPGMRAWGEIAQEEREKNLLAR